MGLLDLIKNLFRVPTSEQSEALLRAPSPEPGPVSVVEVGAAKLMAGRRGGKSPLLLDCREPFEWRQVRIPGRLHMPMNTIPYRLAELGKEADIVVACAHGNRSYDVAGFLAEHGCTASSLRGGLGAWQAQGGEVESDYGG